MANDFVVAGERFPLVDRGRGIRTPRGWPARLSILTAVPRSGRPRRYDDDEGPDGLLGLVEAGDIGARRLVSDAGTAVGAAVANLCNLLCPQRVVIGGQLATTGSVLLDPLRRAVARDAIEKVAQAVQIVPGELGDRAETMGAVALALADAPLPS